MKEEEDFIVTAWDTTEHLSPIQIKFTHLIPKLENDYKELYNKGYSIIKTYIKYKESSVSISGIQIFRQNIYGSWTNIEF